MQADEQNDQLGADVMNLIPKGTRCKVDPDLLEHDFGNEDPTRRNDYHINKKQDIDDILHLLNARLLLPKARRYAYNPIPVQKNMIGNGDLITYPFL